MKNAATVFLLITALFVCVMIGAVIGRYTSDHYYVLDEIKVPDTTLPIIPTEPQGKLNINTATHYQLSELPDIGPILAQRIIDYRTENGDFQDVEELTQVEGIGEKRLEALREYITTGG